jgi:hypothetical protein
MQKPKKPSTYQFFQSRHLKWQGGLITLANHNLLLVISEPIDFSFEFILELT